MNQVWTVEDGNMKCAGKPAGYIRTVADYKNFIMIGIKPFMDAHTFDQDRIDRCCVHIVDRSGNPVSFCEYNAINRPRGNL